MILKARCPHCRNTVEVLPDGHLAHHRPLPGCGEPCPREKAEVEG